MLALGVQLLMNLMTKFISDIHTSGPMRKDFALYSFPDLMFLRT